MRNKAFRVNGNEGSSGPVNLAMAHCQIGICIVIVPVGSYELVPGSHPFAGRPAARSQCRNSGLAGDGAELCRLQAFQAELRQSAGRGVYPSLGQLGEWFERSSHWITLSFLLIV
jgi:hypothetical protein